MKPVKRVIFVELEYYECTVEKHRHKTESAAQNCIDRNANRRPMKDILEVSRRRSVMVTAGILNGLTGREAGELIGVSGSRSIQLVKALIRRIQTSRYDCDHSYGSSSIPQMRVDKGYWFGQLRKFELYWEVN